MTNTEIMNLVHDEIKTSLNLVLYNLEYRLEINNASKDARKKAIEYYNRLQSEFNRSLFMREYRDERIEDCRREY